MGSGIPGRSQRCDRNRSGDAGAFLPDSASAGPTGLDGTGQFGAPTWPHLPPRGGTPARCCGCIALFGWRGAYGSLPGRRGSGFGTSRPRSWRAVGFVTASRAGGTGSPLPARPVSVIPPHPRRGCIALPAAALRSCFPRPFAARPSARYRLDKSKAAQRLSIPCGCYLRGNRPELPFGHRRSSPEADRALPGERHPGNPGVALKPSLNVRLDRSAWTGKDFALSSCSVLGVAFSSSC